MALHTTRGQLVEMLRDEAGISSASSRGMDNLAKLHRLISRIYETLVDDFDWTFLRVDNDAATKVLEAGQRFYDFPVAMDFGTVVSADHFYGNVWVPLDYGITPADYTAMNPETNQRADPLRKWRTYSDTQFEVWPLPASTGNLVRFRGRRKAQRLVDDDSRADMDDQLIVLYAAAEILAKSNQKDAELKLAAANKRLLQLRRNASDKTRVRVGMGERESERGWPRVRAFKASN